MQRNIFIAITLVVLCAVVAAAAYFLTRPVFQTAGGGVGVGVTPSQAPGLSAGVGKPKPYATNYKGCPPSGDGGDPALNTLKNRIDEGQWQPTTVAALLALSWPRSIEQQSRARWSPADTQAIAQHEGTPVQIEGYLALARQQSPESCNCHSVQDVDFHIWVTDDPSKTRDQSVVVEASPRVRSVHPAWTIAALRDITSRQQKVRISGWLMMDPEHPDQIGKTRGTIWEIHPIMQIETEQFGKWTPLDNGTTGVTSSPSAPQTESTIAPADTATVPPPNVAENNGIQVNNRVQITNVFYNGVKGTSEPDEYVEIVNKGPEPVDITDWELQDQLFAHQFKWDSYTMQPGQTIRVYTNEVHPETGGFSFNSGRAIWRNSGDVAELYDSDQKLVSEYGYGDKK